MATIRELGPNKWEVRVFVGTRAGKPLQVSRTVNGSRRAAEKRGHELEAQYARVGATALKRTVAVALEEWQEAHVDWATLTKRDYASRAADVIKDKKFARTRLDRLERADLTAYVKRLRAAKVPEGAIRNRVAVIRAAVGHAVEETHLKINPIAGFKLHQPKRPKPEIVDDEDVVTPYLEAAAKRGAIRLLAAALALVTGARRAELGGLKWTDLRGSALTFRRQILVIDGERVVENHLKGGSSHRSIELDEETVELWKQAKKSQGQYPSVYVFGDPGRGDIPPSPDRVYRWHCQVMKDAELPHDRLHALRHWSASSAISEGHSPVEVSQRLGNTPETVMRTYAQATRSSKAALGSTMGSLVGRLRKHDPAPEWVSWVAALLVSFDPQVGEPDLT
jgi:integrase